MTSQWPPNIIDMVNRLVRTSRDMTRETGGEPTPKELAEKLTIPVDQVHRLLEIAKTPINLGD